MRTCGKSWRMLWCHYNSGRVVSNYDHTEEAIFINTSKHCTAMIAFLVTHLHIEGSRYEQTSLQVFELRLLLWLVLYIDQLGESIWLLATMNGSSDLQNKIYVCFDVLQFFVHSYGTVTSLTKLCQQNILRLGQTQVVVFCLPFLERKTLG